MSTTLPEGTPSELPAEPAAAAAEPRSFWRHVAGTLRGEHYDYTKGSLHKAILLLAVPMVLEMGLESTFALVDIFWVNHIDSGWFGATPTELAWAFPNLGNFPAADLGFMRR